MEGIPDTRLPRSGSGSPGRPRRGSQPALRWIGAHDAERRRGAIEVVEQVERVDHGERPDDRERRAARSLENPPQPRSVLQSSRPAAAAASTRTTGLSVNVIVDVPTNPHSDGSDRDRPQTGVERLEGKQAGEEAGQNRHAAEIRGRSGVGLIAGRVIEEPGPDGQPDCQGCRRGRDREGDRDRQRNPPLNRQRPCPRRHGRRSPAAAMTSSIASSTVRAGRQPVSECTAEMSGTRRPSSSNPSSYASE